MGDGREEREEIEKHRAQEKREDRENRIDRAMWMSGSRSGLTLNVPRRRRCRTRERLRGLPMP